MTGENEYGHCNSNCPMANESSNNANSNKRFGESFLKAIYC